MLFALPMFLILRGGPDAASRAQPWRDTRAVLGLDSAAIPCSFSTCGTALCQRKLEAPHSYLNPTLVLGLGSCCFGAGEPGSSWWRSRELRRRAVRVRQRVSLQGVTCRSARPSFWQRDELRRLSGVYGEE